MVARKWAHSDLMAMTEDDFCWWLQEQIDYDEAVAEARRAAQEH